MDNIYRYRLFLKTIETGNITRTAESFYVSQSAVSQQLKHLEEYFGKALFYKEKTLRLTSFGLSIKDEVEQLVSYYDHKENFIFNLSKNDDLALNIIAKSSFIMNLLMNYLKKHPLDINAVRNGSNNAICKDIESGKSHIGFGDLEPGFRYIKAIQVLDIPIVLCLNKNHKLTKTKDITIQDLKNERLILYDDQTFIGNHIQSLLMKHKIYPKSVLRSNHSEIIQELTDSKYGIGFVYKHTAHNKNLAYRKITDTVISKPYSLLYNPKFVNAYQEQVIDNLLKFFEVENKRLNK